TRLRSARSGKISPALSENLRRLGERAFAKRREILRGAAALALVALAGAWRIRVDSDFLYYFEPSSEVRRANETINQKIVGSNPFYIVIDGGAPGALRRWEVLKLIKDLQGFLARQPGITSSISVVDYLEVLEAGFNKQEEGGDLLIDEQGNLVPAEAPKPFWQDPKSLGPLLDTMMKSPETFKSVVTKDFSRASILVRTNLSGSRRIEETLDTIRRYVAERFPAVGDPIVYTTIALFFGFLTFALSGFVPIKNFGILAGVTMATALGANLVLLPALLATTKIITLWDLLGVKLGDDPARTIPLFAGLRPSQARIVVLMGELKHYLPGEAIVRRGERGDEMYVIIDGMTE